MNEVEQQDSWKALQAELGLTPAEPAATSPRAQPRAEEPVEEAGRRSAPHFEPREVPDMWTPRDIEEVGVPVGEAGPDDAAGSGLEEPLETAAVDNVEVGEAPEEVPEAEPEPAAEGEKRRRRRRRRRGRRGRDATAAEEEAVGAGAEAPAIGDGHGTDESAEGEELGDESDLEDDDEDEVEPLSFTDWNMPTWNELIASLYRPER
jgi:hypothetical protein